MGKVSKSLCLLLVVMLAAVSLLAIYPTYAQSIPKPSVPEFDVVIASQDQNYTKIIVTIKSQPFTPYQNITTKIDLYYNVQSKEHLSANWTTISYYDGIGWLTQNKSDYTSLDYWLNSTPANRQIDFRVQAMVGDFRYILTGQQPSGYSPAFTGQTGDWSSIKTIRIPAANSSPAPSPTVPELPWVALLPLCLIVLGVALVLKRRKKTRV